MWKVDVNGKWLDLRSDQKEAVEKYRSLRDVSVPHGAYGTFDVKFKTGPLHDNMEYVYTTDTGNDVVLKYNPKPMTKSPPKERKWYTKVNFKWVPSYPHQIAGVEQYRASTISIPHHAGGTQPFKVDFRTIDTPGRATRYTYITTAIKAVEMKYTERKKASSSSSSSRKSTRSRSKSRSSSSSPGTRGKRAKGTVTVASPAAEPHTVDKQAAYDLYGRYNNGYAPPTWALERYDPTDPDMNEVEIYTTSHDAAAIKQCAAEREPVNIAMGKYYKDPQESGYTRYYQQHKRLGPNLAIYTRCLMSSKVRQLVDDKRVHVINSIGFAFDDERQPDYKYYMNNFTAEKRAELMTALSNAFRLVFKCAFNHGRRKVCICYLGGGAFRELFKPKKEAYLPFFMEALQNATDQLEKDGFVLDEMNLMGGQLVSGVYEEIQKMLQKEPYASRIRQTKFLGYIPAILDETTLFMNAWDPHSVVGNGNEADGSLDGYFGRLSDMALLCTPATNPRMLTKPVIVVD